MNPSTEEAIGTVPEGVEADIDAAVAAARKAFATSGWSDATPVTRADAMQRFAQAIAKRGKDIARMVSAQNGMPLSLSQILEGQAPTDIMRYYGDLARSLDEPDVRQTQMGKAALVQNTPIGVAAAIIPWNFPVTLALSKIAPAMAAGCTMVIKPSPGTVLDAYILAEAALEADIPPGVLNWVAAIRIANDSQFGLGGSVWSADTDHATNVARAIQSGTVGVNGYRPLLGAPFGGIKASGIGREFGPEAVTAYQHTKSIYMMG